MRHCSKADGSENLQTTDDERARQLLAQESARIIVDQGLRDYRHCKSQRRQTGSAFNRRGALPGNAEIEQAISRTPGSSSTETHMPADLLQRLRVAALAAMQLLEAYSPRLVGPVLVGTADENSAVQSARFCR